MAGHVVPYNAISEAKMAAHHAMEAPVFISSSVVLDLVSMGDIVDAMSSAFLQYSQRSSGAVVQPVRTVIPVQDHNGYMFVMPAYCRGSNSLGTKLVTLYPDNEKQDLPSHLGIVLLFDATNGQLQALIDGSELTTMRTAAASAAAVKALVPRPPSVLCIVGSGVQARSHVQAFRTCYRFSEIRIWGRTKAKAVKCAEDVGGDEVKAMDSLEEAIKDADIIVTVTIATEPVVMGKWLKPGAVVSCVGACRPDWRELDDELMQNSVVIADSKEAAMKESGDIILSKADVFAEIGEIIGGTKTMPKVPECGKKFIMFKSLGMAVEDVVSSKLVYDRYMEKQGQAKL